jgi:gliding motility-associated lipoprotein GldH
VKKILLFLTASLLLVSCSKRVLLDETHDFANNIWLRFEPEVFKVDVKNIDDPYLVTMTLSYDTSLFDYETLPLSVEFFVDSNARHTFFPSIRLVNSDGVRRGTVIGQYCTVSDTLDRCRLYNEADQYTYRIKQRTSKYEIDGISGVGLKIEKL